MPYTVGRIERFVRAIPSWLCLSIKLKTAKTNPNNNIIQPIIDAGIKKIPILLNQGKFISVSFIVNK